MIRGLILKTNKRHLKTYVKRLHISQVNLDTFCSSDEPVQVIITSGKRKYILCTLRKNTVQQVALNLNFSEEDDIEFTTQGNGSVYLAGDFIPQDDDFMNQLRDEEVEKDTSIATVNSELDGNMHEVDYKNEEEEDVDSEQELRIKQRKVEKVKQNGLYNNISASQEKLIKDKKQIQEKLVKAQEKTIQGGVKIEDVRVGNGAEAQAGKEVQVYYEGRLKSNNKVFDAFTSKQGTGFQFRLCRGEVIRGWDKGIAGMKVGGKRIITCPPNMAYDSKGYFPVIPPNSKVVFEIELKGVR